jgi:hypothetical protein
MPIWFAWIAAKAAMGWAFGRNTVTAARGGSVLASLGVGVVALGALVGGIWIWLAVHDSAVTRVATTFCEERARADALAAENTALKGALAEKDRRLVRNAEALTKAEADLAQLETEKKDLRDAAARLEGASNVVFDAADDWLRQGRPATAVKTGRR